MATSTYNGYAPTKRKPKGGAKRFWTGRNKGSSNGASAKIKPVTAVSRLRFILSFTRRLYQLLLVGLAVLICIFIYDNRMVVNDFVNQPVSSVALGGEMKHIDHEKLQGLLSALVSQRFFELNIDLLSENIRQIPWVSDVHIRKQWPDQIKVVVSERIPVARWGSNALIDNTGVTFSTDGDRSEFLVLPLLSGPEQLKEKLIEKHKKVVSVFETLNIVVEKMDLSNTESWSLTIKDGPTVIIGKNNFDTRLVRFSVLWKTISAEQLKKIATMDFRYSNGVAVSEWKNQIDNLGVQR